MKIYRLKNIMCDPQLPDGDYVLYSEVVTGTVSAKYYDEQMNDMKDNWLNQLELFNRALDRIKDMLMQDDGQAYKEAERFYEQHRGDLDE